MLAGASTPVFVRHSESHSADAVSCTLTDTMAAML